MIDKSYYKIYSRNIYHFFLQLKVCLKHCIHITHPHLNEEMILSMFERTICTILVFHAVNVK